MSLNSTIDVLPKIGEVMKKKLERVGIKTIEDLIYYFPSRYEDFSKIVPISKVKLNENNCVCGKILEIETQKTWKKKLTITEGIIQDKTGALRAVWFGQRYLTNTLKPAETICLAGKVKFDKNGLFLNNPVYEKVWSNDLTHTGRIIPIYPETRGLSSRFLRWIIKPVVERFKDELSEVIPKEILKKEKLLPLKKAITEIHFPSSFETLEKAKERFSFEQLFVLQIAVLRQRIKLYQQKAPSIPLDVKLIKELVNSLPFKLTDAQRKCTWQIVKDLERPYPMSRLLEGDVGSGKTVVAVLALLNVVKKSGLQAAFMAPTEILAKQHFKEVCKLLQPFKIKIGLLTGKQDKIVSQKMGYKTKGGFRPEVMEISKQKLLERTEKGEIDLLIGTHSLIQDKVKFFNLGLAIIDEQHRFGVKQRANLISQKSQKTIPHLLSMTATPIPRTLALTIYGDLDLSLLDELPKGRKEITTKIVSKREEAYDFVRKEVKKGRQAFVICPKIEGGSELKAVKTEYEKLKRDIFPNLKIEMLHGKMKTKEKEKIMEKFKNKKADILVSTSVVEVGVDVPNATCMIIEGAERFGLAQLHQFRGRIGRSNIQSYCFLFTDSKSQKTIQRLNAILKAKNGFELAEKDLKIRGPGSFYGVNQWGMPDLAMESLKDLKLVEKTRESAKECLKKDPLLKNNPDLKEASEKFSQKAHLE